MFFYRLKRFAIAFLILLTILGIAGWQAYEYKIRQLVANSEVTLSQAPHFLHSEVQLGSEAILEYNLKVPWGTKLTGVELIKDKDSGLFLAGEAEIRRNYLHWEYVGYQVQLKLVPYRTGEIVAGEVKFESEKTTTQLEKSSFAEPTPLLNVIELTDLQDLTELPLAGEIKVNSLKPHHYFMMAMVVMVVALIMFAVYRILKRGSEIITEPTPPWELAITELVWLREEALKGDYPRIYAMLSDVFRRYLELRYSLKISTTTTPEFLKALRYTNLRLTPTQRHRLEEFMLFADLVKFAKKEPDLEMINGAIDSVQRFVTETIPQPEDDILGGEKSV